MTNIYLNNDAYPSSEGKGNLSHSRNISTLSSATLFTSTTLHSQPNEPLLNPTSPEAVAYYDQISQQPRDADGTPARMRWGTSSALGADSEKEANAYWKARPVHRKASPCRWTTFVLEVVMATWVAYNAVRYYIAFTMYNDSVGQSYSLALGTTSGISFLLTSLSFTLSTFRPSLTRRGLGNKYIRHARTFLRVLSSFCLLGPAAVNLALVLIWRNPPSVQSDIQRRCHLDVDIVWSVSNKLCKDRSQPQGVWLAISVLRLVLTLTIIIAYYAICFIHPDNPRRRASHLHLRADSYPISPFVSTQMSAPDGIGRGAIALSSSSVTIPVSSTHDLSRQRQVSDSTLTPTASSQLDSPGSSHTRSRINLARSRSSGLSGDISPSSSAGDRPEPIIFVRPPSRAELDCNSNLINERESNSFVDRFRSLISQITRETDEAIKFSRSDGAPSPENTSENSHRTNPSTHQIDNPSSYTRGSYERSDEQIDDYNDDNDELSDNDDDGQQWLGNLSGHSPHGVSQMPNHFNLPPVPPVLGYNEFGMPYPPDENIRVLNGIIRRMPTIESMGSGEVGSSIGTGSIARYPDGSIMLNGTGSRPPTRNTLASYVSRSSWSGTEYETGHSSSRPPSQAGSLSARAELLAGRRASTSHSNGHSASGSLSDAGPPSPVFYPSEYGELLSHARPETAFGMRRASTPSSFGTAGSYQQAPVNGSQRPLTPHSLEVNEHGVISRSDGRSGSTETTLSSASPSSTMSFHTATMGSS